MPAALWCMPHTLTTHVRRTMGDLQPTEDRQCVSPCWCSLLQLLFLFFCFFSSFPFFFCLFFRMSVFHILPNIHKTSYLAFLPKRQLHNKYKAEIRGHEWILIKRKLRDHSNNVLITSLFKYFKVF